MKRHLLNDWRVNHYEYNQDVRFINAPDFVPEGFLRTSGPELVQGILRRYGKLRQPVFGKDLEDEKWVEERDWVYYTEFFAEKGIGTVSLCFDGLDTFCDIYLNGEKLGFCRNMHIPHKFDVTNKLNYSGRNKLFIRFYSPVKYVENFSAPGVFSTTTIDRIYARKAQMNYSWDFCGRCVTMGIWKDVYLEYAETPAIKGFYLYTDKIAVESARMGLQVEVDGMGASGLSIRCEIRDSVQTVGIADIQCADVNTAMIDVINPKLWWPRPYGEQHLYSLTIELIQNGAIIDKREHTFGIRTVEIIEESMTDGISFKFRVNGRDLFIRGANWVPIHTVYTSIRDDDYDVLLEYAADGNLSMLRVWGGGIYESDRFFELCDRLGILVSQDFMLACGVYPQTEDFFAQIREEAEYVLKKYRNYTSLASWAGDNEDDQAYTWAGKQAEFIHDKINKVVLLEAWKEFDPHRAFAESSPCSPHRDAPGADDPNSDVQGDTHIYRCRINPELDGYYKTIKNLKPRFMSEFGFISLPEKESFYQFNFTREPLCPKPGEPVVGYDPNKLCKTPDPSGADSSDELVYFFQLYNSLGFKYWIEYFRSLKGVCMGSLYWKFNDPVADTGERNFFPMLMATVDMYKRPKMTYYFTKRAYEDTIVYCSDNEDSLTVGFVNEKTYSITGTLSVKIKTTKGDKTVWSHNGAASVLADCAGILMTIPDSEYKDLSATKHYMIIRFEGDNGELFENIHYFADICDILKLELEKANISVKFADETDSKVTLVVTADAFVPCVRLGMLSDDVRFSDNYFTLEPGQEKTVEISYVGSSTDAQCAPLQKYPLFTESINSERKIHE